MQNIYCSSDTDRRKMRFLYHQSGIDKRYSVIPDYSRGIHDWKFYPQSENLEPFPNLEHRMAVYNRYAPQLSVDAIRNCLDCAGHDTRITHLITVSCTGMSAPGLDLQVLELMDLDKNIFRTSVNFMGCYAAIHALKMADAFCKADAKAQVMIVCTELCTLHFQREGTMDNIASSLLFSDGAAACLVSNLPEKGLQLEHFYSEVVPKGKRDMAWELSSSGFLMTLSGYVPDLIEEDFQAVVRRSLQHGNMQHDEISDWCIHPGGKRILEAIQKSIGITPQDLSCSYDVLRSYGNMSSATILFVLKEIMHERKARKNIFAAAFGPGLTVETFTASHT